MVCPGRAVHHGDCIAGPVDHERVAHALVHFHGRRITAHRDGPHEGPGAHTCRLVLGCLSEVAAQDSERVAGPVDHEGLGVDGVLDDVDGMLAHRDGAQHAAGLVVEDADRVTAGVGDEDVAVDIVHLDIAGRCAHGHGVQQRPGVVVEDADRVSGQIGDEDALGRRVHAERRWCLAHQGRHPAARRRFAHGGGVQQRSRLVVEDADGAAAQIGDESPAGRLVHSQSSGVLAYRDGAHDGVLLDLAQDIEPVDERQLDVEQDDLGVIARVAICVRAAAKDEIERLRTVARDMSPIGDVECFECLKRQLQVIWIVFDEKDLYAAAGNHVLAPPRVK